MRWLFLFFVFGSGSCVIWNKIWDPNLRESSENAMRTVVDKLFIGKGSLVISLKQFSIPSDIGKTVYTRSESFIGSFNVEGYIVETVEEVMKMKQLGTRVAIALACGEPDLEALKTTLRRLWLDMESLNIYVLSVYTEDQNGEEKIHFYNPFYDKLIEMRVEENFEQASESRWKDLNGYRVRAVITPSYLGYSEVRNGGKLKGSGLDGMYLHELARYMNFSVELIKNPHFGGYDENNGSFTGAFADMTERRADMVLNARFIKWYHTSELQFTGTVYEEEVCVVTRTNGLIRGWDVFLRIFDWKVWLLIFVLSAMANHTLATIKWIEEGKYSPKDTLPQTLRVMFMIPLRKTPATDSQRILIGFCLLSGIVIVTSYQGELFGFVKSKNSYKNMDTLEELYESGLPIIAHSTLLDTFQGFENRDIRNLESRLISKEGRSKAAWFDNHAVLMRMREYDLIKQNGRYDYRFELHVIAECPRKYNIGYVFPRGSPYLNFIESHFTSRVFEGSLMTRWYRETVIAEMEFRAKRYPDWKRKPTEPEVRVFSLKDMEVSFFSLAVGLCLSIFCFVVELIIHYFFHKSPADPPNPFFPYKN